MFNTLIAGKVFNTVVMIDSSKFDAIAGYMQQRVLGKSDSDNIVKSTDKSAYQEEEMFIIDPRSGKDITSLITSQRGDEGERPYYEQNMVINESVAFIGLQGILVNRKGKMNGMSSEFTSYHRLRDNLETCRSRGIKNVILDVDSPGGEAIGGKEIAEFIYSLRGEMNITAIISGMCCSAAYFIASACSKIVISETSFAGHVGCRYRRWDITEAISDKNIKYKDFYAGEAKLEGDPSVEITDEEEKKINEDVNFHYQIFTECVAKYLGLPVQTIKDTQANVFYGKKAVEIGFAHSVMDAHDAVSNIYQDIINEENSMNAKSGSDSGKADKDVISKNTEIESKSTESKEEVDVAGIQSEAIKSERTRIKAIFSSEHANGRNEMAQHLAFETDLSADESIGMLKVAPEQSTSSSAKDSLSSLMEKEEKPDLTNSSSTKEGELSPQQKARAKWVADRKQERGVE